MTKFTDNIASYKQPITDELIKLINNQLKAQASLQKHYARIMIPTDLMWLETLQELSVDPDFKPEIACRAMKKYYSDIINRIGDYYAKQGIDTEYYKVIGKKKYLDLNLVMQSLNYESETNDDKMMYDLNGKESGGVDGEVDKDSDKPSGMQNGLDDSKIEKDGAGDRSEIGQNNSKQSDDQNMLDSKITEEKHAGDASRAVGKMQRKKKNLFSKLFKHRNLIRKQIIVIRW